MDLLDQTEHGYSKCGRKCDSFDNFICKINIKAATY